MRNSDCTVSVTAELETIPSVLDDTFKLACELRSLCGTAADNLNGPRPEQCGEKTPSGGFKA